MSKCKRERDRAREGGKESEREMEEVLGTERGPVL